MATSGGPVQNNPSGPSRPASIAQQVASAVELPVIFVGTVIVGGLLGAGLDHWLHTRPVATLLCGAIGFAAAIRELLRRVSKETR